MLRTSRKWKNAVRFQARAAFPAEWKVHEFTTAPQVFPFAHACAVVFPLETILRGTTKASRIGSKIRVRRIEIRGIVVATGRSGLENIGCVQLEKWVHPDLVPSSQHTNTLQAYQPPYDGADWIRGSYRTPGGVSYDVDTENYPAVLTTERMQVLRRRVFSLFKTPAFIDNATVGAAATSPFPDAASFVTPIGSGQSFGFYPEERQTVPHVAIGAGSLAGGSYQIGSLPVAAGTIEQQTHRVRVGGGGLHHKKFRIVYSWSRGMEASFDDYDAAAGTVVYEKTNHLCIRIGCTALSRGNDSVENPGSMKSVMSVRVWFTDE